MHKEHESYGRNDAQFVVIQRKKIPRRNFLSARYEEHSMRRRICAFVLGGDGVASLFL